MVRFRPCEVCGRIIEASSSGLCHRCGDQDEEHFEKVRDFIKQHPQVSIPVVAEATNVSESSIREMIRDGRLKLNDPAMFSYD